MAYSRLSKTVVIITTISAAIMELIDTSIVNVALNTISGNLGATLEDASWIITAYAIANVIVIPMTGFLSKYFGRKNYYLTSIIIFTIASYLCGTSSSLGELIVWRFVQGIGGGALLSVSQGILFDAFSPSQKPIAAGLFGMGVVIGPTIGPTLGGYIIDNYNWQLIFDINIFFGILASLLAYYFVEKKLDELQIDRKSIRFDFSGVVFLIVGIGSLQFVLERGQTDDWFNDKTILLMSCLAFFGLLAFVWRQLTAASPIVNLRVLKSRNLASSNIITFICGFGLFGSVYLFPEMVQQVMHYTPTESGLSLVPGALITVFIMPIIGLALSKGVYPLIFVAAGFILFILFGYQMSLASPFASRWWFFMPQVLRGLGTACLTVPITNQAIVGLKQADVPYGISLNNMFRQIGGAFGISILNTYTARKFAAHRTDLLENIRDNNPLLQSRIAMVTHTFHQRISSFQYLRNQLSYSVVNRAIDMQAQMKSYLDGFLLISIVFALAIPVLFLLKTSKIDPESRAILASESH